MDFLVGVKKTRSALWDGSDEFDESPVIPMKKRRKIKIKAGKNKKRRRKNYSIYQDFEDVWFRGCTLRGFNPILHGV